MHNMMFLRAATIALTFTVACSSTDDPTTPAAELPDTLSGIVYDENDEIVADVSICVHDRDDIPCVTTDEQGQYDLRLPQGEDVVISYDKAGHVPKLRMYRSNGDAFRFWPFQRHDYYRAQFEGTGIVWDEDAAMITSHPGPGATLSLDPTVGDGPFYMNEDLDLDPDLTETSTVGVAAYGNVTPGTYSIAATKTETGTACEPHAWNVAGDAGEVVAMAGHITSVDLTCE